MNAKTSVMQRKRIDWVDLAKGIGILLVVWAHAKGPGANYIYQFHMPLFFLISGYLYSSKDSWPRFLWKRICGLYIPFVFWNVLAFLIRFKVQYPPISWETTKDVILRVFLTLDKNGRVFGASWFLGALFLTAIVYKTLDVLLWKLPLKKWVLGVLFIGCACASFLIPLPYTLNRTVILGMFYAIGVLVKERGKAWKKLLHPVLGILFLLIFAFVGRNHTANMGANRYTSPVFFVLGSLMMSYVILYASYLIDLGIQKLKERAENGHPVKLVAGLTGGMKRFVVWLGKNSMDLVLWQFVFFRVVTLCQIILWDLPLADTFLEYPGVYITDGYWWIAYFAVGTLLSALWGALLRTGFWGKVLKFLHIV